MNLIVAVDKKWGIGCEGKLLAHIPEDMKYFKEKTIGNVVVMGRATLESLPKGKPLVDRENIVLSRDKAYQGEGYTVIHSIKALLKELEQYKDREVFIIGGEAIYNTLLPYCNYAYVTKMDDVFKSDRYLIDIDQLDNWSMIFSSEKKEHKGLSYYFTVYENNDVKGLE